MALTPEDIVNKRFQSTKFREGYDQDEVDDFLDEVVVEMRRVSEENAQLKTELQAAEARIAELQRAGGSATPAAPVSTTSMDDPIDAEGTTNLLQLARRLHEEHVREGIQKRDELIAEGHSQAARIVSEAEAEHQRRVAEYKREQQAVENKVESLREFEREYRQSLRGFIEGQLSTLEHTGIETATPAPTPMTAPTVVASQTGATEVTPVTGEQPEVDEADESDDSDRQD
jgi:DivIVA domain-containing protein